MYIHMQVHVYTNVHTFTYIQTHTLHTSNIKAYT